MPHHSAKLVIIVFHLLFEDKKEGKTRIKTPIKYIIGTNLSIYLCNLFFY